MWKTLSLALLCTAAGDEFLSRKGATRARCLLQGWANDAQAKDLVNVAQDCFTPQTAASSSSSKARCLECGLSTATGCVVRKLNRLWGWRPELAGSGSNTGGPYDVLDAGITLVGVETPSGSWQFMLRKPQAAGHGRGGRGSEPGSSHAVDVQSHHRGDASEQQEADLIRFAESCFSNTKTDLDTSDPDSLKMTLGNSVDCVLQKCLEAWGFKPKESVYGSDTGGPHAYSLGATVIGVESPSGKWDVVLHLK